MKSVSVVGILAIQAIAVLGRPHDQPSPSPSLRPSPVVKRAANCNFPVPSTTTSLPTARPVPKSFDGGNARFDRGEGACKNQNEGGSSGAVFVLDPGATLSNVVIGANQAEGVHCLGSCTLKNVWFEDVCEDAVTVLQTSGTTSIVGGGARHASDKVIQHNGGGTVNIDSFCVEDFGKLYRSCGNCSKQTKRTVNISNVIANSGKLIAGVNSNYGDVATITGLQATNVNHVCEEYTGNDDQKEPTKVATDSHSASCKF